MLERLAAKEFDLVAVGRALISNPDWVELVRSGKTEDLRAFEKSHLATLA
jgi:2,4-dienoyl-CoA reductase-like NADH-dependent reductase (Old Yellow Enzyme family)